MKLDSRIIDVIKKSVNIYDPDKKLTAEDLKSLKRLKLSNRVKGESESDISLVGLGKLGMIEHLSLTGFTLGESELDEIASIKMLKSIALNDCRGGVIDLPNLEKVSIAGGEFESILFDKLPKEYIIENYKGEDVFRYIDAYDSSSLNGLTLINCKVQSTDGFNDLSGMKRLAIYGSMLPDNSRSALDELERNGITIVNQEHYKPVLEDR